MSPSNPLTADDFNEIVRVSNEFKAMSEPIRVRLLLLIDEGHQYSGVTRLAELAGESIALTSHHLKRSVEHELLERPAPRQFRLTDKGEWWLAVARRI